jgi:CheY-like chemotaxis protein
MTEATDTILLVEDEEHDVEFLQRAFRKCGIPNPVRVVSNGEEAMAYLGGTGVFADRTAFPFPRVLVTDLKMPQMGGLELLRWVHANPKYRVVPTIVLTSSTNQADIAAAFEHGAAGYFVKPVAFEQLERIARVIWEYWRLSLVPGNGST